MELYELAFVLILSFVALVGTHLLCGDRIRILNFGGLLGVLAVLALAFAQKADWVTEERYQDSELFWFAFLSSGAVACATLFVSWARRFLDTSYDRARSASPFRDDIDRPGRIYDQRH